MRIILIGFMGCGKSRLGRHLAGKLKLPFYDTDELIEEEHGYSISEIFTNSGEEYFRQLERAKALSLPAVCLAATGGGIVEDIENRKFLQQKSNFVVWLHPSWEDIYRRINKSDRPKVRDLSRDELYLLWKQRLLYYRECADYLFENGDEAVLLREITRKVL